MATVVVATADVGGGGGFTIAVGSAALVARLMNRSDLPDPPATDEADGSIAADDDSGSRAALQVEDA